MHPTCQTASGPECGPGKHAPIGAVNLFPQSMCWRRLGIAVTETASKARVERARVTEKVRAMAMECGNWEWVKADRRGGEVMETSGTIRHVLL